MARSTHPYGSHPSQLGELFLPSGIGPHPVCVVVHGGYWRAQYDRSLMEGLCTDLSAHGVAAWNLEYRRVGAGGGWPETFLDVAAGIDLLAGLDAPLDLSRVAAVGHSAGGQLALWAAARRDAAVRLAGVVSQAGVHDLREADRLGLGENATAPFMGGHPDEVPDAYADASPIERVPVGVPQLLVHGDADDVVPASQSTAYAEAAQEAGDEVDLVLRPGEDHFVHLDPAGGAWADVVRWLARFGA